MWSKLGFGRVFDAAQRNMELALAICATMEVSLMTTILLDLASPQRRSFSRVIAYAFWLRSRYHCHDNTVYRIKFTAHDTAHYHQRGVENVGREGGVQGAGASKSPVAVRDVVRHAVGVVML